ncbi:MAG: tRNA dihydrouridine synthase DusB [Elusimicrobiota bacterium]
MLKSMKIGNIQIKNNLMLAPLAGISIQPFRLAIKRFGSALVYTEMISSYALAHESEKTRSMIDIHDNERPVSVQLFGNDPEVFQEAAAIAEEMGADIIDLNMGCPSSKVVNGGSGAALMQKPGLIKKIVNKVAQRVKAPVTVKIRAGWDERTINAVEVGKIAEGEGAKMVTIHARTKSQRFGPHFDWSIIGKLKNSLSIPVIGNGNVFTVYDAQKMFNETGCDGIMIGRAAYSNPWIFEQIIDFYTKGFYTEKSALERLDYAIYFVHSLVEYFGGAKGLLESRKFVGWLTKGLPGSADIRKKCYFTTEVEEVVEVLNNYKKELGC